MDPQRFDRLSKAVASSISRREAVGGLGIAGVLAALLPWRVGFAQSDEAVACRLDFEANVRLGPSLESNQTVELKGDLDLIINRSGSITKGSLTTDQRDELKVTGHAIGRAVNLRIDLGDGRTLVAIGTAANDFIACDGEVGGPATGPQRGDIGDWFAVASPAEPGAAEVVVTASATSQSANDDDASGTPDATDEPDATEPPTSDTACELECLDDTLGLDPATCTCGCPDGLTPCVWEIGSLPAKGGVIFLGQPVTVRTGVCLDTSSDPVNCGGCGVQCALDERTAQATCDAGVCSYVCNPGYGQCGTNQCTTDLNYDSANCGACGAVCGSGYQCSGGYCQCLLACLSPFVLDETMCSCVCEGGLTDCGGVCIDTTTDAFNCGSCGVLCDATELCQSGACQPPAASQ